MRSVKYTQIAPTHMLKFNFFKYLYTREMYEHSTNEWANWENIGHKSVNWMKQSHCLLQQQALF
jgi:hypothetical protein